jgi:hypothetical protein
MPWNRLPFCSEFASQRGIVDGRDAIASIVSNSFSLRRSSQFFVSRPSHVAQHCWRNMESGRCWTSFRCFGKLTGMGGQAARDGFRAVSLACASLALALALMTFVGWISGLRLLASVRAKYIPMAPSSALCFSLIGIGIIIIMQIVRPALRWITRVVAALVLAIACVKLVEFLGGFHFEIDAWFVRNPGMFGAVPTGRMAPMTALNFVFLAGGLLTLSGDQSRRWAGALGALATIIGTVILVGYWYGTPLL